MNRPLALLAAAAAVVALMAGCDAGAPTAINNAPASETTAAPQMPTDAPPQEEVAVSAAPTAAAGSCAAEIGEAAAARLVERCIMVSPATRPPCNVQNSCELIQSEIDRSCTLFADDPPEQCAP